MRFTIVFALAVLGLMAGLHKPASAQAAKSGLDKLYVINCGEGHATDKSRWSPGIDVGQPFDVVDNCYLMHHVQGGWFLWDTGVVDTVADMPNGAGGENGAPTWRKPKKLSAALAEIGVKPSDVRYVAISHTHPDHIGNVELFPQATLLVQKAEYEWPLPSGASRFKPEHPVQKLEGDDDVFGDGSAVILSTPGHTPGHQSLMVTLPKTGTVILSGDAVHFKSNWDNRRVPGTNFDKEKTLASMQRIADLMAQKHAQLWMNHDKAQAETIKFEPAFYE